MVRSYWNPTSRRFPRNGQFGESSQAQTSIVVIEVTSGNIFGALADVNTVEEQGEEGAGRKIVENKRVE